MKAYQDALDSAEKELRELTLNLETWAKRVRTAESRILVLRSLINGLNLSLGKEIPFPVGATNAIKTVLIAAEEPLGAPEIRTTLAEIGFDIVKYEQPLAMIHTVVNRLVNRNLVTRTCGGKVIWKKGRELES